MPAASMTSMPEALTLPAASRAELSAAVFRLAIRPWRPWQLSSISSPTSSPKRSTTSRPPAPTSTEMLAWRSSIPRHQLRRRHRRSFLDQLSRSPAAAQIAAAASGGASGDNSNLTQMTNLQNQSIINGDTPDDAFSNLTFSIGNTISQANSDATATGNILTQLQNQQSSVEGVSLDEESSNLLLYERSFQAAAKVISTVDTLMGNVLDMGVIEPGVLNHESQSQLRLRHGQH